MKWWSVSVGSHTTLLCVPGVPGGQFMSANMSACQDACVGAATCNGVNYLDGHGEGPSYCFLKNCTYPEFPPAVSNGMFDYYSAAVYTTAVPQPNPCDGITSRTSCDDLVYCNWCTPAILRSSCAQLLTRLRALRCNASRPAHRGKPGCDSWDPLVGPYPIPGNTCDKGPPVPPAPPPSCAMMCKTDDDCDYHQPQGRCRCDTTKGPNPVCVEA